MNETQYIWKNDKFIPWHQATTHVLTHGLHYGSAVFEGIRCYQTENGPAIFKLREHVDRFFYSAKQLGMNIPYSKNAIEKAIVETVDKNNVPEAYIRPLAYYGYGSMQVMPVENLPVEIIIACWPWGQYLPVEAVDIVTSQYIRLHPLSTVTDAKISGHYVNSILASLAIRGTHYHEALLLDADGYVAEGSAENIFIVKDNKLITTPNGTILVGITRNIVIEIARKFGIAVEERKFKLEEVYAADEAFFTGTAVEITPIRSVDDIKIISNNADSITRKIKNYYQKMIHGEIPEFHSSLTYINKSSQEAA